jgi:indole-3-glycerol phosphate synthase|tara:strand:+ start:258 stop:923 length:666 start_codon:yes stop_codon:yes gene_type:complete
VIAECKRRSPSRGVLSDVYHPADIASGYAHAGAAAVSVLTEPAFFDGRLEHLEAVREAVEVPLLRKDFILTDYQLLEACVAGADAVLLIAAILDTSELRRLLRQARDYGLAALTEVHNAEELSRSLEAGAEVIGVNNRDLRSFEVDVEASEVLMQQIPGDVTAVAESGLTSAVELIGLRRAGYHAFLIGGAFMCKPVPGEALSDLLRDVHLKTKVLSDGGG